MPAMYSFCFWFSVRLGSIMVGAFSLIQAFAFLIVVTLGYQDKPNVSKTIREWLDSSHMLFLKDPLSDMSKDPGGSLLFCIIFSSIYAFSCLLLIYGAYRCNVFFMYPFMGLDLVRLLFLTICFIFATILLKENSYNLGLLIGFSVGGGFLLLYLFYLWFCVLSMKQIVRELEKLANSDTYQQPLSKQIYNKQIPLNPPRGLGMNYYDNGYDMLSRPSY